MRTCTFSYKQFSSRIEIENSQRNECCCLVHALLSNGIRNEKKRRIIFLISFEPAWETLQCNSILSSSSFLWPFFYRWVSYKERKEQKVQFEPQQRKKVSTKRWHSILVWLSLSLCICEKFYVAHESERRRYTQFSNTFLYVLSSIILFVFFSMHLMIEQSDFFFQCSH